MKVWQENSRKPRIRLKQMNTFPQIQKLSVDSAKHPPYLTEQNKLIGSKDIYIKTKET